MRRVIVILALFVSSCAINPAPAPLPPVQPHSFQTGLVLFMDPQQDEFSHYSAWKPLLRIPVYTGSGAQVALDTFGPGWPLILLVETVDDPLIQAIAALGPHAGMYVELGNELAFVQDADYMNAFYKRSIVTLTAAGWSVSQIITGGVANIEPKTQHWLEQSIVGLPAGVNIGWHGYSQWKANAGTLVQMLNGRPSCMTEAWSINLQNEPQAAAQVASDLQVMYQTGTTMAVFYQNHSGSIPPDSNDFGLHNQFSGQWRLLVEQVLIDARR